jgi:hypothetical protein
VKQLPPVAVLSEGSESGLALSLTGSRSSESARGSMDGELYASQSSYPRYRVACVSNLSTNLCSLLTELFARGG